MKWIILLTFIVINIRLNEATQYLHHVSITNNHQLWVRFETQYKWFELKLVYLDWFLWGPFDWRNWQKTYLDVEKEQKSAENKSKNAKLFCLPNTEQWILNTTVIIHWVNVLLCTKMRHIYIGSSFRNVRVCSYRIWPILKSESLSLLLFFDFHTEICRKLTYIFKPLPNH